MIDTGFFLFFFFLSAAIMIKALCILDGSDRALRLRGLDSNRDFALGERLSHLLEKLVATEKKTKSSKY